MHGSSHSEMGGKTLKKQLPESKMQCQVEQSKQMPIEFKVSLLTLPT
jgi:hypothetical protein